MPWLFLLVLVPVAGVGAMLLLRRQAEFAMEGGPDPDAWEGTRRRSPGLGLVIEPEPEAPRAPIVRTVHQPRPPKSAARLSLTPMKAAVVDDEEEAEVEETWESLPETRQGLEALRNKAPAPVIEAPVEAPEPVRADPQMRVAALVEALHAGEEAPAAAPAPLAAPAPVPAVTGTVTEKVAVVLRRQVPVRDEPPRSWIGGLPMMPESVAWPLGPTTDHPEYGRTPLHFAAQIACEDLPADLWGGLGPRTGWLLLFLNGQDWDTFDNPEAVQVLHIDALGPERAPPPGIRPVYDEMCVGPDYDFVRNQEEIPAKWRRWPVDVVAITNQLVEGAGRPTIIPDDFALELYDGAPVGEQLYHPQVRMPFSWRGALYIVDSVARVLATPHAPQYDPLREQVFEPGWIGAAIERVDAEIGRWEQNPAMHAAAGGSESAIARERRATIMQRIDDLHATRALLAESGDGETLIATIDQSFQNYVAWCEAAKIRVDAFREEITKGDLDQPMDLPDWEALRYELEIERQPYWTLVSGGADRLLPVRIDKSLLDFAARGLDAAQLQVAADYYVSPQLRPMVPDEIVAELEPHWRALYSNRPHQMGGMHDGIQSEPSEVPANQLLLFQIATDTAMHWMWGDAGAYYVFIDAERLAAGDFTRIEAWFENH